MDILWSSIAAVVTGGLSSLITFLTTKKKYKAEVTDSILENLSKSMDIYKDLLEDADQQIQQLLEKNNVLEKQIELQSAQIITLQAEVRELTLKLNEQAHID